MITRPISPTKWRIPTPITATLPGKFSRWATAGALAWRYTVADRKAGLYKATPISYDDIAALPADGKVGDRDVLCATTEFGTLEPFYCPENARQVVCGLPMDDGLTPLRLP